MDYIYRTHVAVPESTIRQICTDLMRNTIHECSGQDIDLTQVQLKLLGQKMNAVTDSMCHSNRISVSVEGWRLDSNQVSEITAELHDYRKIGAVRAFRVATGAGLKEGKHFIDSFCHGPRKESGPPSAMAFQMSFSK